MANGGRLDAPARPESPTVPRAAGRVPALPSVAAEPGDRAIPAAVVFPVIGGRVPGASRVSGSPACRPGIGQRARVNSETVWRRIASSRRAKPKPGPVGTATEPSAATVTGGSMISSVK